MCVVLLGCEMANGKGSHSKGISFGNKYKNVNIEKIRILTAEENTENIWRIDWPETYMSGNQELQLGITPDILNDKDRKYLLEYASEHANTHELDGEFLCRVEISTLEEKTHSDITMYIYDKYPDRFNEFADTINRICGEELFYMNGNTQEITPEYFTVVTGISDEDINGGTAEELIDHLEIDSILILSRYLGNTYLEKITENFYFCQYLQYKEKNASSTEDEWKNFATKLAENLNYSGDISIEKSEYDNLEWYSIKGYKEAEIRIYKSEEISDSIPINKAGLYDRNYLSLKILEYTTEVVGDCAAAYSLYDFTYSNDFKFAVVVITDDAVEKTDYQILFCEVGKSVKRIDKN